MIFMFSADLSRFMYDYTAIFFSRLSATHHDPLRSVSPVVNVKTSEGDKRLSNTTLKYHVCCLLWFIDSLNLCVHRLSSKSFPDIHLNEKSPSSKIFLRKVALNKRYFYFSFLLFRTAFCRPPYYSVLSAQNWHRNGTRLS